MAWYVACRVRGSLPRWMQVSLRRLRAQPDLRDSERFDRALDLFVRQSTIDHEVAALALFPYEVDPVLNMGDAPGDVNSRTQDGPNMIRLDSDWNGPC